MRLAERSMCEHVTLSAEQAKDIVARCETRRAPVAA